MYKKNININAKILLDKIIIKNILTDKLSYNAP